MNFDEYQKKALLTVAYPKKDPSWTYPALGLAGEVGEVEEILKKFIRDATSIDTSERLELLKKELGDVLWYLAVLASEFNFSFQEIAELNIKKLASRKENNKIHGDGDNR